MNKFIEIRRDLHRIPELGFEEHKTQAYLLDYLKKLPQDRLEIVEWKTGLFARVKGTNPKQTLAYRTDIDALPIQEETGLAFQSEHDGKMHACGHDFHMAIALGVVTYFVENPIADDLLFLFQPAEETPGGAEEMIKAKPFRKWKPSQVVALHIAPELPVGTISTKTGLLFANTSEIYVDFKGSGGHAARPHLANDMAIAAAAFVTQVQSIVSRNVNPLDAAVLSIGKLQAGTIGNIIAESASLEGTIRTFDPQVMEMIRQRIVEFAKGFATSYQCEIELDFGSAYYMVDNNEELTNQFIDFVLNETDVDFVQSKKAMTGDDFGFMLKETPGFMFWLGVNSPFGLHHAKLNPKEEAIPVAIQLVSDYFSKQSSR